MSLGNNVHAVKDYLMQFAIQMICDEPPEMETFVFEPVYQYNTCCSSYKADTCKINDFIVVPFFTFLLIFKIIHHLQLNLVQKNFREKKSRDLRKYE